MSRKQVHKGKDTKHWSTRLSAFLFTAAGPSACSSREGSKLASREVPTWNNSWFGFVSSHLISFLKSYYIPSGCFSSIFNGMDSFSTLLLCVLLHKQNKGHKAVFWVFASVAEMLPPSPISPVTQASPSPGLNELQPLPEWLCSLYSQQALGSSYLCLGAFPTHSILGHVQLTASKKPFRPLHHALPSPASAAFVQPHHKERGISSRFCWLFNAYKKYPWAQDNTDTTQQT
jgi:hypothetical protein